MANRHFLGPSNVALPGACHVVNFPRVTDQRGSLSFIEGHVHVSHGLQRVYYLYDVPSGSARGGHAHRRLHRTLVCVSGTIDVVLDDGMALSTVHLDRPDRGLYIAPMIWAVETNFSAGAVCLVLASLPYDESDYIRDYPTYLATVAQQGKQS